MRCAAVTLAIVLVAACGEPADLERQGDRAYAARDFAAAYTAYASAADRDAGADLLTKLGLAALRQGDTPGAIDAFRRLAAADPDRRVEAAEGLAAAANLALAQGNAEALDAIVGAMREIAPDRPVGRWVVALARTGMLNDAELAALAPQGVAAASDAGSGDSLLVAWAGARVRAADCDGAGSLYRAAARRASEAGLAASARSGASGCALAAARQALASSDTAGALDALGSVHQWADADSGAAAAAALAEELRTAAEQLPPMDTTFFMEDR
jgi:tetratricopeptide (TPR) repeat protein